MEEDNKGTKTVGIRSVSFDPRHDFLTVKERGLVLKEVSPHMLIDGPW